MTPRETDEKLAVLFQEHAKLRQKRAYAVATIMNMAGARYYYQGRQRVTDMTLEEAQAKLASDLDAYGLTERRSNGQALEDLTIADQAIYEKDQEIAALEDTYTGWSRFFVVTSSNGHIHSSMHCSTCYPTTTYGWLPNLSGKSQDEAIKHFGPAAEALCSVCFPDAPVARMDANLTQKQTDALLAGETPEATPVKTYCPGSGQRSATEVNWRLYSPHGKCPVCGYVGAVTQSGAMRKHKAKETR
jgi:hypothetical protein